MEEHCLCGDARAERHGATTLTRMGAVHKAFKDKHDRSRGHVAEIAEGCRVNRRVPQVGSREALLGGIQNGAAAGVHSPEVDCRGSVPWVICLPAA